MPAFTALTDLPTVKAQLSITNTNSDVYLTALIGAVSAAISAYCNRNFLSASYTETYDGTGNEWLWLRQRPVSAVASVTLDGVAVQARASVGAMGFTFDKNRLTYAGGVFTEGAQNVTVTYTAGLATISAVATPALWQGAAEWVAMSYRQREHIDKKSDNVSPGGQGTTYLCDMPWTVKAALDPYRQVAPEQVLGD